MKGTAGDGRRRARRGTCHTAPTATRCVHAPGEHTGLTTHGLEVIMNNAKTNWSCGHVGGRIRLSAIFRAIAIPLLVVAGRAGVGPAPNAALAAEATRPQAARQCVGDCGSNGMVTIDEIVQGLNIALGALPISQCPAFDCAGSGRVTIDCIIQAIGAALNGCSTEPGATATSTSAATATQSAPPAATATPSAAATFPSTASPTPSAMRTPTVTVRST